MLHAITELLGDEARVVGERLSSFFRLPPTMFVLERLWQVPMIQRGKRLDSSCLQLVYQAIVEVEPLRIGLAGAFRKDTRPGNGEAVGIGADVLHQRYVFLVAMIMVVGDVAGVVILYVTGCMRVCIPNRKALAIFLPRALDLV